MNTNINPAIAQFFKEKVSKQEFTKHMRKLMDATVMVALEDSPELEWHRANIKEGYYYLSEFLELLEPTE
ncbi:MULTISPECIES: hypothetical protein [Bizionia]|uniref:Uncharacterized protein n=1 Tax=Bizionia algoritergicola TaxID=291187 RepID=A0A5D0QZ90_9FLAO|nr:MULTISPECIES: hypothetical protein [Bizionia]OBX17807.1 hypothetical protein BAA08_15745 [Bizionia sp. APA-3]TYB74573.1 hypothetical protein ES675_00060 [Bizionia algoritergicola]